ncbi:hypothetical protein T07_11580 [Trichinella nelsoni]|uniref:Uncharacterized protein n=1 Tax=Trichinella nelsoni TaxID=6336 RepID=A0A0V0RMI4_9BILA|nr:hypothetical protein T07_11580 [Trichinella nelsoni]
MEKGCRSNLESVTWYWSLTTALHDAIGPLARSWSCLLLASAKVKTAAGILCRSIRTLVLLEPAETHQWAPPIKGESVGNYSAVNLLACT